MESFTGREVPARKTKEEIDQTRLVDLSEAELKEAKENFLKDFPNLSEHERQVYCEELIQHEAIEDREVVTVVNTLSAAERSVLGTFLIDVIGFEQYPQTFYRCFQFLTEEKQQAAVEYCKNKKPESFVALAPFVQMDDFKVISSDSDRNKKDVLTSHFADFDSAAKLLDNLIELSEFQNELREKVEGNIDPTYEDNTLVYGVGFAAALQRLFETYANQHAMLQTEVLFSRLDRLEAVGVSTDKIDEVFKDPDLPARILTKEELEKREEIKGKLFGLGGEKFDDDYGFISPIRCSPREQVFKYLELQANSEKELVRKVFGNFTEYSDRITNVRLFVLNYLFQGWPVFLEVENLGLSKQEILSILEVYRQDAYSVTRLHTYDDVRALIDFDQNHPEEPKLYPFITDWVKNSIRNYSVYNNAGVEGLIMNMDKLDEWFPPDFSDEIRKVIVEERSDLLLYNLSYALGVLKIPFESILAHSGLPIEELIRFYPQVRYHIHHNVQSDAEKTDLNNILHETVLQGVRRDPNLLFDDDYQNALNDLLTNEDRERIIESGLVVPVPQYFFRSLVASSQKETYQDQLKDIALRDKALLREVVESGQVTMYLELLSPDEFKSFVIENLEIIDADNLCRPGGKFLDWWPLEEYEYLASQLEVANSTSGLVGMHNHLLNKLWEVKSERIDGKDENSVRSSLESLTRQLKDVDLRNNPERALGIQKEIEENYKLLKLIKRTNLERAAVGNLPVERKIISEIVVKLKRVCEKNQYAVFDYNVANVLGAYQASPLVMRDVHAYMEINPSVISSSFLSSQLAFGNPGRRASNLLETAMGDQAFEKFVEEYQRAIVFSRVNWSTDVGDGFLRNIPSRLRAGLKDLNPFSQFTREKVKSDYYLDFIDHIKNYKFFPLYQSQLEDIASKQQERFGNQKWTYVDKQFGEAIRVMSLLENSDLARKFYGEVAALTKRQQDEVIQVLAVAAIKNIDKKFDTKDQTLDEILPALSAGIKDSVMNTLQVERVSSESSLNNLPTEVVVGLSEYLNEIREDSRATKVFTNVCQELADKPYESWRTWGGDGFENETVKNDRLLELKERGLLPEVMSLEDYETWSTTKEVSMHEILELELSDYRSGIQDILSLAEVDHHVPDGLLSRDRVVVEQEYKKLTTPLRELSDKLKVYRERLKAIKRGGKEGEVIKPLSNAEQQEYRELQKEIAEYRTQYSEYIDEVKALVYLYDLKNLTSQELETGTLDHFNVSINEVHSLVQKALIPRYPMFAADYDRVVDLLNQAQDSLFSKNRVSRQELRLTDQVDFETHFSIGEKPVESCQSYKSTMGFSKGLISYITDPNVRIVQVRDEQGSLIARSILRLLEDGAGKPALFTERTYSVNPHPKIKEIIAQFAAQKAESIGALLYQEEAVRGNLVKSDQSGVLIDLISRGSLATHVYSDAAGGLQNDGFFRFRPNVKIHYTPKK